jgi:hypothetical protein
MAEDVPDVVVEVQKALDSFEQSVFPVDGEGAMKYLSISQDELRMLSADECGEAAVLLVALSFHVSKQINKLKAQIRYCGEAIMKNVAPRLANYRYNSPDERMCLAIAEDDFSTKMKRHEVTLSCQMDRIEYLPLRLEKSADMFSSLAATRRRRS